MLSNEIPPTGIGAALFGAASVFMAYEGFQLLTYDYEDIKTPQKTLPRAVLSAIVVVIIVYILVTLGTTMLIGANQIIKYEDIALSIAGRKILGSAGLIIVTIAAAFSTGSAINSTLFATARLAYHVAKDGEFPAKLEHKNRAGVPDLAVISLGTLAIILAILGNLRTLVESASLAFLFTFTIVSGLAFRERAGLRSVTGFGAIFGAASSIVLIFRLIQSNLIAFAFLILVVLTALIGRPILLRRLRTR